MNNKCVDCKNDNNCLAQIKESDYYGNIAGCEHGFIEKTSTKNIPHACETCKYYGSSHKRMPCKGCINNGVVHADYYKHFRED